MLYAVILWSFSLIILQQSIGKRTLVCKLKGKSLSPIGLFTQYCYPVRRRPRRHQVTSMSLLCPNRRQCHPKGFLVGDPDHWNICYSGNLSITSRWLFPCISIHAPFELAMTCSENFGFLCHLGLKQTPHMFPMNRNQTLDILRILQVAVN